MDYVIKIAGHPATALAHGITSAGGSAECNGLKFGWSDKLQGVVSQPCTLAQAEMFEGVAGFQVLDAITKELVRETSDPSEEVATLDEDLDLSEDLGSSGAADGDGGAPQNQGGEGQTPPTDEQWLEGFITTFTALTPEVRRSTIPTKKVFLKADYTRACALLKIVAEDKIEAMVSALESFLGLAVASDTATA
jgi:hypothetical protein